MQLTEAHGTGTKLGDPIEAGSLAKAVLAERQSSMPLMCGSVKSSIGHGESTAGMTGLLKLTVGLRYGETAPNAQLRLLNPHLGSTLRCVSCALPVQLSRLSADARHGGVSSFGYSGTIAHLSLIHI